MQRAIPSEIYKGRLNFEGKGGGPYASVPVLPFGLLVSAPPQFWKMAPYPSYPPRSAHAIECGIT